MARRSGSQARLMWALWAPAVCAAANDDHERALDLFREAHASRLISTTCRGDRRWPSTLSRPPSTRRHGRSSAAAPP